MSLNIRRNLKGKYFKKIFANFFLVVLVVSAILISGIYFSSIERIKNVTVNLNQAILSQINKNINGQFKYFDRIMIDLSYSSKINTFFGKEKLAANPDDILMMREILTSLAQIKASNLYIHSIYLYSYRNKTVLSSEKSDINSFYDIEFKDLIPKVKGFQVIDGQINEGGFPEDVIRILRTFPTQSLNQNGLIVINVKKMFLKDIIDELKSINKGEILVMSSNGKVIFQEDVSFISKQIINNSKIYNSLGVEGTKNVNLKDDKALITYETNELTKWKYIYLMTENDISKFYQPLRNITIGLILLTTLIALIFILYISNVLYLPVKKMTDLINKDFLLQGNLKDEFEYVKNSYRGIIDDKSRLEELVESNWSALRERFLYLLLSSENVDENVLQQKCDYFKINLEYPHFTVVSCEINYENNEYESNKNFENYVSERIRQSFWEKGCVVFFVDIYLQRFSILINHSELFNIKETIKDIFQQIEIVEYTGKNNNDENNSSKYRLLAGIGNTCEKPGDIQRSFYQSIFALSKTYLNESKSNVLTINETGKKNDVFYFPYIYQKQLLDAINAKSTVEVEKTTTQIFETLSEENMMDLDVYKDFILQIIASIFKISALRSTDKKYINEEDVYSKIKSADNLAQVVEQLNYCSQRTIDSLTEKDNNKYKDTIDKLSLYIEKNYSKDININDLAEMAFFSTSHLSRTFKDCTGKTLNEYINSVRIENAKKILLTASSYSIEKVAESVGYNNKQNFLRNFKIIEGITPTEYRYKNSNINKT